MEDKRTDTEKVWDIARQLYDARILGDDAHGISDISFKDASKAIAFAYMYPHTCKLRDPITDLTSPVVVQVDSAAYMEAMNAEIHGAGC